MKHLKSKSSKIKKKVSKYIINSVLVNLLDFDNVIRAKALGFNFIN